MNRPELRPQWGFFKSTGVALLLALAYYGLAFASLRLATVNENASPVWPATGLAIAIVWALGPRFSLAVFLGSLLANWQTSAPWGAVVAIAVGNTLEPLIAVGLLRFFNRQKAIYVVHSETASLLLSGLLAALVSAGIGMGSLGYLSGTSFDDTIRGMLTWWLGNVLGAWVVFPFLLAIFGLVRDRKSPRLLEVAPWILVTIGFTGVLIFGFSDRTTLFALFPLLLLVAHRTNRFGIFFSSFLICLICVLGTANGYGPFRGGTLNQNLIHLQLFLSSLAVTALVISDYKRVISLRRPSFVLLVGWGVSAVLVFFVQRLETRALSSRFDSDIIRAESDIRSHMNAYENALRGGASLYAAKPNIQRREWAPFIQNLNILQNYPGIRGIGKVAYVHDSQLKAWLAETRKDGAPDFKLHDYPNTKSVGEYRMIIKFSEPETKRRSVVLGLDISGEPIRREAAEKARETGRFTLSRGIHLFSEESAKAHGFLAFLPIRERPGFGFEGWIYAPFSTYDFFKATLVNTADVLSVGVFENRATDQVDLIYSSEGATQAKQSAFDKITEMQIGGRTFYYGWKRGKSYIVDRDMSSAWLGALAALMTLLLAGSVVNLQLLGKRANEISEERTLQLRILSRISDFFSRDPKADAVYLGVIDILREELDWAYGAYWGYDLAEHRMVFRQAAHDRRARFQEFETKSQQTQIFPGRGMVGLAWEKGETIWIENIQDTNFFRSEVARQCGLRGAFAFPVQIDGKTVAVLELFSEHPEPRNLYLCDTLNLISARVGEYLKRVETQMDLEQQKQLLIHSSKMSALGEMAGGIAHEINNPLAIINGRGLLLQRAIEQDKIDRSELLRSTEIIMSTVDRIAKIITGLRAFARRADQDPLVMTSVSQLIDSTIEFCRERFRHHHVSLEVAPFEEKWIYCREAQISQVLLNLLNNAFDAVVQLPEKWVIVEVQTVGRAIEVSVVDSGAGISEDIMDKIMQPFFTTKEVGKGTGLGLSISLGIVLDHGGTLTLDRSSRNTRFVMRLPLEKPPSEEA